MPWAEFGRPLGAWDLRGRGPQGGALGYIGSPPWGGWRRTVNLLLRHAIKSLLGTGGRNVDGFVGAISGHVLDEGPVGGG